MNGVKPPLNVNQLALTDVDARLPLGAGPKITGASRSAMPAPGSLTRTEPNDHQRNRFTETETDAVPPLRPGSVPKPLIDEMPNASDDTTKPDPPTVPLFW